MKKLMDLIEQYNFTCEAGPLELCTEWIELKERCLGCGCHSEQAHECPEYADGKCKLVE